MAVQQRLLGLFVLALAGTLSLGARSPAEGLNTSREAAEARMKKDIFFLASEQCEGRGVYGKGINLAADYIADTFKSIGLKPGGPDGSYFQPFRLQGAARLISPNTLVIKGPKDQQDLKQTEQFQVSGLSTSGKLSTGLVFVGYGATASGINYDDYAGVNAEGKLVIVMRKQPRFGKAFDTSSKTNHGSLQTKIANAEAHKAAGVIFVNDKNSAGEEDRLMDFSFAQFDSPAKFPVVHVRRAVVDGLLKASINKSLDDVEKAIDDELKPQSVEIKDQTANLQTSIRRAEVKNVVGYLEGAGPLAKEVVVLGAHYDHVGRGDQPGAMGGTRGMSQIWYGADDNGSGSTMIMELARRFAAKPNRQGRTLVFITFSAEELGLFGSVHYCKEPRFPLADTVAMINLDMVGRLRPDPDNQHDKMTVYGTGSAENFDSLLESANKKYEFSFKKIKTGLGPSDQDSFFRKNIPVLFFFTEEHPDYHTPRDTPDKINLAGMFKIAAMVEEIATQLETTPDRPKFTKVAGSAPQRNPVTGPRSPRPTIGIKPAYGEEGKEGVLLTDVLEDTPAAKAGLKGGDRILEMGSKPVKNLEAYMSLMSTYKKGDTIEMTILREGQKMPVKVKLD